MKIGPISLTSKIFLFVSFLISIGCITYLVKNSKTADSFDKFEMYDPDNPELAADSMSVLYKQTMLDQGYIESNKRQRESVELSLRNLDHFAIEEDKLLENGKLSANGENILSQLSTWSLYKLAINVNYDNYYNQSKYAYSAYLSRVLGNANFVPQDRARFASTSYNYFPNSADSLGKSKQLVINTKPLLDIPIAATKFLTGLDTTLKNEFNNLTSEIQDKSKKFKNLQNKYFKSRIDIRAQAITWGILAFTLTAVILYCVGAYFREKRISSIDKSLSNDPNFLQSIKDSTWTSVYMITVLLLIITIFILGLAGLLQENTLAALLGGIAGYVLNNRTDSKSFPVSTTNNNPQGNGNNAPAK